MLPIYKYSNHLNSFTFQQLIKIVVFSKQFDSYVVTSEGTQSTDDAKLNSSDLVDVLKHNFGSLIAKPSQDAMNFIKQFSNTAATIFNPIKANYLIIIKGNLDKLTQQAIAGASAVRTSLELENTGSSHLFDQIFNTENAQSLINASSAFNDDLKKKEFYIFSQDKSFSNYFENFGISVSVDAQGNVKIEDKQVNQVHNGDKFQKCVNKAIGDKYRYDAAQNAIFKISTTQKITIDSTNSAEVKSFLSELCGIQLVSSSFKKDNASFLALEISSLAKIEKVLSAESYAIAQDIIAQSVQKVINHYQKTHKNNNFGQIIFAQDENDNQFLVSQESKKMKVRVLETQALTPDQVKAAQSYTLRSWFSIFFIALIFFVCYALFNVEISKDSLLYAKFIAEERR